MLGLDERVDARTMMITKKQALRMLCDGEEATHAEAARVLGVSTKSISNWKTDERGRLVQKPVIDLVTATIFRRYLSKLLRGEIDPEGDFASWETVMDLITLPRRDDETTS